MKIITRTQRKIKVFFEALLRLPAEWSLQTSARAQRERYRARKDIFTSQYQALPMDRKNTTELWEQFNEQLSRSLLPWPSWRFLRDKTISQTMVMTRGDSLLREQITYLKNHFSQYNLQDILHEDPFGAPKLDAREFGSSHNSIHHLYHIARFSNSTKTDPKSIETIIEWGGGYGNFAKLWLRISPSATYCIVDTPILLCLQWIYLSVVQERPVRIISDHNHRIESGVINLIPLARRDILPRCDLFVSTWGLSECPIFLQDEVAHTRWYGARHLLLGYQESNASLPDASHLGRCAIRDGAYQEDLPFKNQHYAFR